MSNSFDKLKEHSIIVADTGEVSLIKSIKPQDATTNPSLILQAAGKEEYRNLIDEAVNWAKKRGGNEEEVAENFMDKLSVNFGLEILQHIPGYVSTEIDTSLSFNAEKMIHRAKKIIRLYETEGIERDRILIKIAATWEGIKAGMVLREENIKSNLTLMFSITQAIACAENGIFLISPFVGRILDWHKKNHPDENYSADKDPGVQFVQSVYRYYKSHSYSTVIMAASFRNIGEIIELTGCDRLTISPALIHELKNSSIEPVPKMKEIGTPPGKRKSNYHEDEFRSELNDNLMATEKLAEGIYKFKQDYNQLRQLITKRYF